MSNTYQLTKKIYELLPQVKDKYGLEFEIESDYWYHTPKKSDFKNRIFHYSEISNHFYNFETKHLKDYFIPAIQEPQIRQILVVLSRVLGENPEKYSEQSEANFWLTEIEKWLETKKTKVNNQEFFLNKAIYQYGVRIGKLLVIPDSKAEALCQKWLGGLKPLFNRESKTVLQELVEILENLLNLK
jgi:hypothetical protein